MRKLKITITLLSFVILVSSLCTASILVDDGFEGYEVGKNPPAPWEPFVRSEQDSEVFQVDDSMAFSGTRSLHIVNAPSDWSSFGALFESDARIITYELYAYTEISDVRTLIMIMSSDNIQADADDGKANYIAFRSTGLLEYHDGAWHSVVEYKTNTWHHLACEINLDTQTYDIYIDDMATPAFEDAAFWHPVDKLSYALLRVSPTGGPYWVDNIFAYEGSIGSETAASVEPKDKLATRWSQLKIVR